MKIGLITYGSLDAASGGCLYDRMLIERLQKEGDQVDTIVLPWQSYALRLADNLAEELYEKLRDAPFDLLLQDEMCHPSLFRLNRRLRGRVEYPIVTIVHRLHSGRARPAWQNHLFREVERRYLESVDGFVYSSQVAQGMVEGLVEDSRPAVIAYPAGDRLGQVIGLEQIATRAREEGPLRVLFIGDLVPRRGLHILLDALARLERSGWHLTIAGSASVDRVYARSIADRLRRDQLLDRVTHTSLLDGAGLVIRYAGSHVLAAPSPYEAIDITHLEGMSFGLPTITGAAAAAGEVVTHDVNGFLIPPGDAEMLAGLLQALHTDRDRLLAMSRAARARFDAHPTWSQSTGLIYKFLHDLSLQQ